MATQAQIRLGKVLQSISNPATPPPTPFWICDNDVDSGMVGNGHEDRPLTIIAGVGGYMVKSGKNGVIAFNPLTNHVVIGSQHNAEAHLAQRLTK